MAFKLVLAVVAVGGWMRVLDEAQKIRNPWIKDAVLLSMTALALWAVFE